MNAGERIRDARKEKGITQKQLGKLLNVTQATIQQYESGNPKIETLQKIADALDVTLDYLLGLTSKPDTRKATQLDFDKFTGWSNAKTVELAASEHEMLEKFKRLPLESRQRIETIIDYDFALYVHPENDKKGNSDD